MEIVFDNVTYEYNGKKYLEKINLKINGSKITGVTGDNKTRFSELIDSLIEPSYGHIIIDGERVTEKNIQEMQRRVALIKQRTEDQFFTNNVKEEMELLVERLDYRNKDIEKKMKDALIMVGLTDDYLDKSILQLSAGEIKLIQIAMGLLCNPKVIILDEPFVELDGNNKKMLVRIIKMLKDRYNKTIIITSNNNDMLYELTEELIVIDKTKVVAADDTAKIYQDIKFLEHYNVEIPSLVKFTYLAKKKKVKLNYHRDILDLIKDVYKHV